MIGLLPSTAKGIGPHLCSSCSGKRRRSLRWTCSLLVSALAVTNQSNSMANKDQDMPSRTLRSTSRRY
ncbi:hypothetical protein IF2G_11103 [Cordyceps javanica]|nr:hypothetical protein IF2G_11103 [Cordyceps javanica]